MIRIRTTLAAMGVTAAVLTTVAAAPAATASAEPGPSKSTKASKASKASTPQAGASASNSASKPEPCTGAFQDDARLGPQWLPKKWQRPVGPLLKGWKRTGGLTPSAFLKKYWQGPADTGSWKYPPNDGFATVNGQVDKHPEKLDKGERLDRFGSEFGSFLAPEGDSYAKRALPPQNLNTRDAAYACDYRVYKVAKPFSVWQGGIAPWFEQPGGGQQIKLDPVFLDPGEGQRLNVKWLLDHGYLTPAGA
ncbi:TNT domain-containing protein [Streptomyces sp. NPDC059063]|uniref:TNT domain-containing protein n=1 Tax=unclassified Streptomyces TaxID=2593676 RepID=UPI003679B0BF